MQRETVIQITAVQWLLPRLTRRQVLRRQVAGDEREMKRAREEVVSPFEATFDDP
jgi:hypothetical protein